MRVLGYYEECWRAGTPDLHIADFVRDEPYQCEGLVLSYLCKSTLIFAAMGVSVDVLGSDGQILGGDSLLTDGEWVWRKDLGFYVETYHLELPGDFLDRVKVFEGQPPEVSVERLKELTFDISRTFG